MPIRNEALRRLRRYEDPAAGIYEEFADERLGPGRALALLAGPLDGRPRGGWVIVPSLGPEHGNLRRLEALLARRLAAAGFCVVRIRPDVHPLHRDVALGTRLAEVGEAVELVRAAGGVDAVGAAGALFGGTVAGLAAERHELPALALVQPAPRGRQYARELVRREAVAQLMGAEEDADAAATTPMDELKASGSTWIRGVRLTRESYDELSGLSLMDELRTFAGRALLVDVSPAGAVSPGTRKLEERLAELGADVTVEALEDPLYAPLGEYYYRDAGLLRVDTRLDLDLRLAEVLAAWAVAGPVRAGVA